MSYGTPPSFRYLKDPALRASLVRLRSAIGPILSHNILPHFTDHSIAHSDALVKIANSLVEPLSGKHKLSNDEAMQICYVILLLLSR